MTELETKVQKTIANKEVKFIVPNNCVTVCPWIIRNGYKNVTEQGFVPNNANPSDYGNFQKIFDGNESITVTWEDSTYLTKVEDSYEFKYNFQVGKYYFGAIIVGSAEAGNEISQMAGNEDYMAMKLDSTVVIRFEDWIPSEEDMYKLFTIPDKYGKKFFTISNVKYFNDLQFEEGINNSSIPVCEVTFTSLIDKLQNTGRAVEQYIQYGAAGEPYTIPVVVNRRQESLPPTEWYEPEKVIQNEIVQPSKLKYIQVEQQGLAATSAIQVVGRKLHQDDDGNWISSPWKHLLFTKCIAPQLNDINRTSLPSKNYYYFPEEVLMYRTSQDFQTSIKLMNDAIATNHQAGQLTLGATGDWKIGGTAKKPQEGAIYASNQINSSWNTHYDYTSYLWTPASNFIGWSKTWTLQGNPYCVTSLTATTSDTFVDLMNKQSFAFQTQAVLPLGFYSSKPYHISSIPVIGGLVAKLYGDLTINPNTTGVAPLKLSYFIDCNASNLLGSIYSDGGAIDGRYTAPLLALSGEEAPKWLGTTACNSTFCFELSDKLEDGKDTIYFGQTKDENGNWIMPEDEQGKHPPYLYNGQKAIHTTDIYCIDEVFVQSLFNGKIKLTCYDNNINSVFNTTVLSRSNWTQSLRDWTTQIKLGCWGQEYCRWTQQDWPWPERSAKEIYPRGYLDYSSDSSDWDRQNNSLRILYWPPFSDNPQWFSPFYNVNRLPEGSFFLQTRSNVVKTIPYNEIDTSISTVEEFKEKYETALINFDKSNINAKRIGGTDIKSVECSYISKYSIPIPEGEVVEKPIIINTFGFSNGFKSDLAGQTNLDNEDIRTNYTPVGKGTHESGGTVTSVRVRMEFNQNNITVTIIDTTYLATTSTEITPAGYYVIGNKDLFYKINIPFIEFIPREQEPEEEPEEEVE